MNMNTTRMPALFIGHGTPMNTLDDNSPTKVWRGIGGSLPRPEAILAISAHWYVPVLAVTAMETPRTIHDFGGFPQALYDFQYPAPGSPALAARVQELLAPLAVAEDQSWGLDHGTWSTLAHMYPKADIPVAQLSLDRNQPPGFQYDLGKRLAPLRDEGVLMDGSGNVVHNLMRMDTHLPAHPWASRFEQKVRDHLLRGDHEPLIDYPRLDHEARLAVPTPEHYLPLLMVIGALRETDAVSFPDAGIGMASLSMLCVVIGNTA